MASNKTHKRIKEVTNKHAKKQWQAQSNRLRRRAKSKLKRVC